MNIPISIVVTVVAALAGAIGVLYRQNLAQQKQVETLLSESKELMGSLAELIRNCNSLMVEVKETIQLCKRVADDSSRSH